MPHKNCAGTTLKTGLRNGYEHTLKMYVIVRMRCLQMQISDFTASSDVTCS